MIIFCYCLQYDLVVGLYSYYFMFFLSLFLKKDFFLFFPLLYKTGPDNSAL
jgi:hypothetical protein